MLSRHFPLIIVIVLCSYSLHCQIVDPVFHYGSEAIAVSADIFDSGILNIAENKLLQAIKLYPENPSLDKSILLQAEIDKVHGNFKISEVRLTDFINHRTNSPFVAYAALQRGFLTLEQKDFARTEIFMKEAQRFAEIDLKERQDSDYAVIAHSAIYWRGIAMVQQGKYQDAHSVFEECSKKYPNGIYSDDALFALGISSEINRKFDNAIEYFRKIETDYPRSNSYLTSLIREANNRLILRDPTSALVALQKAENVYNHTQSQDSIGRLYETQSYSSNAGEEILYLKGEAYNLAGNYDQALMIFNAFLETYMDSQLKNYVRLAAGWALLNKNENEAALKQYEDIIFSLQKTEESRIKALAHLYKSIALARNGQLNQARNELTALSVQPSFPFLDLVLLELGQIYYLEGEFDQSRKTLERADREARDAVVSVRIHLLLGAVYLELNKWEKAVNEYKQSEQLALKSNEIAMPKKLWYISESRLKHGIALIKSHRSAEAIPVLLSFIGDNKKDNRVDEALFWLGEAYYRSDLYNNAIETYTNLLQLFSDTKRREEVLYGLGWSYFRIRNFQKSSSTFDLMIKEFPASQFAIEVLTRQGDGYYLAKNFKAAADSYRRAKNLAPNTEEGQYSAYQLSQALYHLNNYEDAFNSLMDFIKAYPRSSYSPFSVYLMGWIRFLQKNYNESIEHFKYLVNSYSQSSLVPRAHYAIGDSYFNMGKYESAVESYRTVIESFPSNDLAPEALKSIQQCYIILGRDEEALKIADSYIQSNPNSPFAPEFKFKKADMFYSGKKYKDAVSEYENFIQKYPENDKNPEAMYWMEKSYISLNDAENAVSTFKSLRQKYPKSEFVPVGMLELGLMKKQLNDAQGADSLFKLVQITYPKSSSSPQAGFERAMMKYSMGDTIAAIDIFRSVADDYPGTQYSDQSRWQLAMHLRSLGLNDSARAEFAILALREDNPDIAAESQYRIGELYFRDKNYIMAIQAFNLFKEKYSTYDEWYPLALLNLGECYENLEKYDEAKEIYQSLKTLRPDDDYGKTAARRLKRLE